MKPTLLSLSLLLALTTAQAAEPAPRAGESAPADKAAAREELAELRTQIADLSRRMADLSVQLGDVGPRAYAFRYITDPDRAIIGVVLAAEPRGARIEAVTPDSPAERAGLRSGDVVTAIDGKPLAGKEPADKLADARTRLGELKEGQDVRIAYERGGKSRGELSLSAERRAAQSWPRLIASEDEGRTRLEIDREVRESMREAQVEMKRAHAEMARAGVESQRAASEADRARAEAGLARLEALRDIRPGWDLNLTALGPDLGRYFGTDSGVLVLSAGNDALAGLKAGDVIRKIGGRPIARPEEALRALRDEPTGSEVELDLLRERKTVALKVKVPEYKSIFRIGRAAPLPPEPPEPPSPPTAPDAPASVPPGVAPPPRPASAPSAPEPPDAPTPPVAGTRVAAVSPGAARDGRHVGAPGLWGGVIVDARRSGDAYCLNVMSYRLDPTSGRPLAKSTRTTHFLACQDETFDPSAFSRGTLATFAGRVAEPQAGKTIPTPTLVVTDAKAWGKVDTSRFGSSLPPQGYEQGQARMVREAAYEPRH